MEAAEEEAEVRPVFWADDGLKILDDIGKERVIAPEILFDPQLIEMDEWVRFIFFFFVVGCCAFPLPVPSSPDSRAGHPRVGARIHQQVRRPGRARPVAQHRRQWR
jgi:hypothetical protein